MTDAGKFEAAHRRLLRVAEAIGRVVLGKDDVIRTILAGLVSGGHVLLDDVPGVGKTLLARSVARAVTASFARIQCTPDLLPSDVTGTYVWDPRDVAFHFRPGPVFHQVLLVDEINRATPRTQAALLEAMEERQVTLDGKSHPLPRPFLVMATQNPVEMEGTFPLPEAELDRFRLRARLGYPDRAIEVRMLEEQRLTHPLDRLEPVIDVETWLGIERVVAEVEVTRPVRDYIASLSGATRTSEDLDLGASPRASLALMRAAQAQALFRSGEPFVTPQDVKDVGASVLAHRLVLKTRARLAGLTEERVVERILRSTPVPVSPVEV